MDKCIICGDTGSLITIGEKGAVGINKAAQQRGSNLQAVSGQSAVMNGKKRSYDVLPVLTTECQQSILATCYARLILLGVE